MSLTMEQATKKKKKTLKNVKSVRSHYSKEFWNQMKNISWIQTVAKRIQRDKDIFFQSR